MIGCRYLSQPQWRPDTDMEQCRATAAISHPTPYCAIPKQKHPMPATTSASPLSKTRTRLHQPKMLITTLYRKTCLHDKWSGEKDNVMMMTMTMLRDKKICPPPNPPIRPQEQVPLLPLSLQWHCVSVLPACRGFLFGNKRAAAAASLTPCNVCFVICTVFCKSSKNEPPSEASITPILVRSNGETGKRAIPGYYLGHLCPSPPATTSPPPPPHPHPSQNCAPNPFFDCLLLNRFRLLSPPACPPPCP